MQIRKLEETKPWYLRTNAYLIVYIGLWLFELLLLYNVLLKIISVGFSSETIVFVILDAAYVVLLFITPYRFKHFFMNRDFGEKHGKALPISNNSTENLSNFEEYEKKLSSFFGFSIQNEFLILDSKKINDKSMGIMILISITILFDIFGILMIIFLNFGTGPSLSLFGSILVLSYVAFRSYNQRETNYQLKINSENVIISLKLTNGKTRKLRSISSKNIDFVTFEKVRSFYRLKIGSISKKVSFPEHYDQHEIEKIYPVLGQCITEIKNHTLSI